MTHDEHQRERMRFWARIYGSSFLDGNLPERCSDFADTAVAEFDKRFPAPTAVEVARPPILAQWADGVVVSSAELAALREKARLYDKLCSELGPLKKKAEFWDAVASGKIILDHYDGNGWRCWTFGGTATAYFKSATEAVQAAIEAGALGPPTSDAWALK